jgi:hypothetical protein
MTIDLDKMFVLIVNDYGPHGIAFAETGLADATFEKACEDLHSGQFSNPRAVIEFNPIEGTSRDITEEVMEVVREMRDEDDARAQADYEDRFDRDRMHMQAGW